MHPRPVFLVCALLGSAYTDLKLSVDCLIALDPRSLYRLGLYFFFFFFFQAEDGIRDLIVTGVQTCALPIFERFAVRDYRRDPSALRALEEFDAVVYHMGNDHRYHAGVFDTMRAHAGVVDRKSTRLNSSHDQISYAVFCLKKKKTDYHPSNTH